MWSQCDTFLRICVCQGHTHYQWTRALPEGDRVTESGWRSEENLFLLSVLWCIFTCGFDDDCFCESPEWQERKGCSHRDLMWLPNINFMLWDKWKAKAFFLSLSLSPYSLKTTFSFVLSCPVVNKLKQCGQKAIFVFIIITRQLYLSGNGVLCEAQRLITQKKGKQNETKLWNSVWGILNNGTRCWDISAAVCH